MKILLLGEYSGFFNSLKEGLLALNHEVVLASSNDGFKEYPLDISFEPTFFKKRLPKIFRQGIYRIFKKDIAILEVYQKVKKSKEKLTNFDVVFLINEQPITQSPFFDTKILKYIFTHNQTVFLSACGDDYIYINFILNNTLPYHLLSPYLNDKNLKSHYKYSFPYITKKAKKHHDFVFKNIKGVIPADYDYVIAYKKHPLATPLIPFPIRIHLLKYQTPIINDKVIIFHGINHFNYYKKGNHIFKKALEIIQAKYADKVKIITTVDLPYNKYINEYNSCHILLDQVFSYDQGYNALEAMAKGKVVFTGAEQEWLGYYKLEKDTVAINALPNTEKIVDKLEWLILNPEKIIEISKNARSFIEKEHNYINIASEYISKWTVSN